MKIISKKTQWDAITYIVRMAKTVHLDSFDGDTQSQIKQFDEFAIRVTDLVCALGGMEGLAYLESRCGISSVR